MSASDHLLMVVDPMARRNDGESVRIAKDVLSAGADIKLCLPEHPAEFARVLDRRGARRVVVIGDDSVLVRTVTHLHRERALDACPLSLVPVGTQVSLAAALGVPADVVTAARAVLRGTVRRRDLLVDDSDGVVIGGLRIPAGDDGDGWGNGFRFEDEEGAEYGAEARYGAGPGDGPGFGDGYVDGSRAGAYGGGADEADGGPGTDGSAGAVRVVPGQGGRSAGYGGGPGRGPLGAAAQGVPAQTDGSADGADRTGGTHDTDGAAGAPGRSGTPRPDNADDADDADDADGTHSTHGAGDAAKGGPGWRRHYRTLVRTLAVRRPPGDAPDAEPGAQAARRAAHPLRRRANGTPQGAGATRLLVEADGITLVGLDQPVTAVRVTPTGKAGLACVEILPAAGRTAATGWLRTRARTVTVSGADFRYRADTTPTGPVRTRTWTVHPSAWGLTLPK